MKTIAVLGATGSIGAQALDLVLRHPDQFSADVLTCHSGYEEMFRLCRIHRPIAAGMVVRPPEIPGELQSIQWFFGPDCSERAIEAVNPDYALCSVVGIAGLPTVLKAMDSCSRILLANKEALVTGGQLVLRKAAEKNVKILPVDSEHSAIFQCLEGAKKNEPTRLILTASGGAFRAWNKRDIECATVEQALGHPTWNMGRKITVDCATMMNKGLELIEAHHLFRMPVERIDVIVHPESTIHSMVEFQDGAVLAQMGVPDMRQAIGYAMGYPMRVPFDGRRLDLVALGKLSFEQPDEARFPCLYYAREAQRVGGTLPVVLNGANEAAVAAFLEGRMLFGGIPRAVEHALERAEVREIRTVEDVYEADREARLLAQEWIDKKG